MNRPHFVGDISLAVPQLVRCSTCVALVFWSDQELHADWHDRLEQR